jgi:hypothetical protein
MAYTNHMASLKAAAEDKSNPDVGKVTSFAVDPRILEVEEGFNARPLDMQHVAKLSLAYSKGKKLKPLDVRLEDGHIYIVDGHHRHAGALDAISKGAKVIPLQCDQFRGTKAECIEHMIDCADSLLLTPMQLAVQIRNLLSLGRTKEQVASRFDYSTEHVKSMALLADAPDDVREAVNAGQISGTAAVAVIKEHGSNAGQVIRESLEVAQASGKTKVTAKVLAKHRAARAPSLKVTLEWFAASKRPDADITVLIDFDGEVYQGYFDGDNWRDASGFPIPPEQVHYWTHMPAAPSTHIKEKTPA